MDLGIRGKTALVTASSAGMGRNIANALAAEGANGLYRALAQSAHAAELASSSSPRSLS